MILGYGVEEDDWKGTTLEPLIVPVKALKKTAGEIDDLLPLLDDCEDCDE